MHRRLERLPTPFECTKLISVVTLTVVRTVLTQTTPICFYSHFPHECYPIGSATSLTVSGREPGADFYRQNAIPVTQAPVSEH